MIFFKSNYKFIVCIFLISFVKTNSQIKNGSIEYGLVFADDKELESGMMANYFSDAKKNAKYISFSLNFNENEMIFFNNNNLKSDDADTSFAIAFSGVNGTFYKEKNSNIVLCELDNKEFGSVVVRKELETNWALTKESKMIDKYLCYKATTTIDIKNSVGSFNRKIIAWFCPKIPIPFGPKGYGNLPGLILELQEKNIVIGVKKINLNLNKIKINKPSQGKTISESEYSKKINGKMEK